MPKYTVDDFIKKSKEKFGDFYDYSKVSFKRIDDNVCIIDPDFGELWQRADSHMNGVTPQKRRFKNIADGEIKSTCVYTTETFIEKARKKFGDLYDYSKVDYVNSKTKVTIIDPEYGEFEVLPNSHLQGTGCRRRAIFNNASKKRLTKEIFIERAIKKHGNLYDYSKVEYINSDTKVCIIHPELGEFFQTPYQHANRGNGHPKLGRKTYNDIDHIVPISIIMDIKRKNKHDKDRPLYEFLNSPINLRIVTMSENKKKSDFIEINGKTYKASNIRNMYDYIRIACLQHLNVDITDIIERDIVFMEKISGIPYMEF